MRGHKCFIPVFIVISIRSGAGFTFFVQILCLLRMNCSLGCPFCCCLVSSFPFGFREQNFGSDCTSSRSLLTLVELFKLISQ